MDDNRVTYFAETDARNKRVKFGLKAKDRTRHVYVIGKTGMGKSTMLENMAVQDIMNGEGMAFIDPHGKTADLLLEYVPKERIRDVIYLAPFDVEYPISFNVLENVEPQKRHLVVSGLMSTFKKIWEDAWSARMEYILTNTLLALLEAPNTTLLGVNRMLSDKEYRKEIVSHIQDPSVKAFWVKEFANYTERMAAEAVPAIQNKVGQFTANPLIRNMIGQAESSFNIREAMDNRKIMIINLSKGRIGDENMKLLGGLIVTKIYLAAMSRADVPDRIAKTLPNFYLYVDEFQNFANASFADILSEARKYKLNLTIAHQYIEQMEENVAAAVFGNVGTMIAFRVGATDAEVLEKEFTPQFLLEDLVNLGFTQIYLKLMIDGLTSSPFSAVTLPPIPHPDQSYVNEIIEASREQFASPRATVEEMIQKFHNPEPPPRKIMEKPVVSAPPIPVPTPMPATPKPMPPKSPITAVPVPPKSSFVPVTHKPFAEALKASNIVKPLSVEKPATVVAPKPEVKPVSLNALNAKPLPRVDLKTATPHNVNQLKDALASILKKAPEAKPKTEKPANKKIDVAAKPTVTTASEPLKIDPKVPLNKPIKTEPKIIFKVSKPVSDEVDLDAPTPKEVPEDVLNNVLKVD